MSQIQALEPVSMGKGCVMRFFIDHSKPTNSIDHHWVETWYDGLPGSVVPVIRPHWHKHHTELMDVLEGKVVFNLDGKEIVREPGDETLPIPNMTVHGFNFCENVKTTLREKTDPAGDFKEAFFRDLFQLGAPTFPLAVRAMYDGDAYMAVPGNSRLLDEAVTAVFATVARLFAPKKLVILPTENKNGTKDALAVESREGISKL